MTNTSINSSCSACGAPLMHGANSCPNCAVAVTKPVAPNVQKGKSKALAVVLAVPFGIFSWLYTDKITSQRFWVSLMVSGLASWMFVVGQISDDEWVRVYSAGIFAFGALSFHVWAIIGNLLKPKSRY